MELPLPNHLCDVCRPLMENLLSTDIPWELEAGIPHQPNIIILEESALTCAFCYQVWIAAGYSLGNRGGMVQFFPRKRIGDNDVTIQSAVSNFGMGGLTRAMANGAVVSNLPDDIKPDISELHWVHPRSMAQNPKEVGSYLFGNWYTSPYTGQENVLKLVGLGVRLGTSPNIGDALGNKPDEWFLAEASKISEWIPGRIRNWDLSSERALSQVKSWLEICDKYHGCLEAELGSGNDPELPTRVLRVNGEADRVFLVETNGLKNRYLALSHSWGQSHRLTLTKSNLAESVAGINLGAIPQTFKDAIAICRFLNIAYLWIDSLCILQDDPADWEKEASKMSGVYMNSYLTVSALHSADDTDGCFPTISRNAKAEPFPFVSPDVVCTGRPTISNAVPFVIPKESLSSEVDSYNHAVVFSIHGKVGESYFITNEWMPPSIESSQKRYGIFNFGTNFDPLKHEPLSSRGWVLQERLLSPRTLHYSEGQMYWECQKIVLGEDGSMLQRKFPRVETLTESRQKSMRIAANPSDTDTQYAADEWLKLIEVFSSRKLTMDYDKLVAISGLAQIIAERSDDEYCAGIWKSNLLNGLCWKRRVFVATHQCSDEAHEHALPSPIASKLVIPADYRAPSWSWAAVDGEITFHTCWLTTSAAQLREVVAKSVNVNVTSLGSFKFGRVKSGSLSIHTVIGELRPASTPLIKPPGQLLDEFRVHATLSAVSGRGLNANLPTEKKGGITKLFSGLKISKTKSSPSLSIPCEVLFDTEEQFPCTLAFITRKFALVLKSKEGNHYTRIGVAEFSGGVNDGFLDASEMSEILIM